MIRERFLGGLPFAVIMINGDNQGIYYDNPASHSTNAEGKDVDNNPIDLAGSGPALKDFSFHINGNCGGGSTWCMASGTFQYTGTDEQVTKLLTERGASIMIGDILGVEHPGTNQFRFQNPDNPSGPSAHLSVNQLRYSTGLGWVEVKQTAPTSGGFHIDAHGTTWSHLVCDLLHGCD